MCTDCSENERSTRHTLKTLSFHPKHSNTHLQLRIFCVCDVKLSSFLREGTIKSILRLLPLLATQTGLAEAGRPPCQREAGQARSGSPCQRRARWPTAAGGSARPVPPPGSSAPLPPYQFSIISLIALAGRWITSPAAMRFTTVSSRRRITPATNAILGARARRQPITSPPPAHVLPPASADAVPARLSQRQVMIGPHECQSKACPRQFLGLRPALNSGRPLGETARRLRVKVHGPLFLLVPSRELREYEICSQWERGCLGGGWSAPARVIWRRTQGVLGARRAPPRLLRPLRSPLSCGLPQYVDDAQED